MNASRASLGLGVVFWVGIFSGQARAVESDWADALFTERGHDFGAVPRGSILRYNFTLANRLGEAVTILDVRASCGCTTGRALANTVPPGQSAVVEAQMDTRNFVGKKATNLIITLVTASGKQAEVQLGVRSNILSDIVLNPGDLNFGLVAKGQASEQVVTIDRTGAPGWRIERMLASRRLSEHLDASLTEAYRTGQGVGYVLTVRLKSDAPAGSVREEIRLATNDRETPVVPILVTAEIRGAITASPNKLVMGQASTASGPVQGRVLVRGAGSFAIRSIEGAGDGFEIVEADPASKPLHILTITFRPENTTARGDLKHSFRVTTDMPGQEPLELQATVRVAP